MKLKFKYKLQLLIIPLIILPELRIVISKKGAKTIEEFIREKAGTENPIKAALINLEKYSLSVLESDAYKMKQFAAPSIKTGRSLENFDCIKAPCTETCAVGQDVPDYMYYVSKGDVETAYKVILKANPLPSVTGMVCDHQCQTKCTRMNYDDVLAIREIKRFVSENIELEPEIFKEKKDGLTVAIIGAGPAGLSAAWFLALNGFNVEVFETRDFSGGMLYNAIPDFRLSKETLVKDVKRVESIGVKIHYGNSVDRKRFDEIEKSFNYIYIAIGAQKAKMTGLPGENSEGVMDQLEFLSKVKRGADYSQFENIVVIGGGNSAMDAARTAWRATGKEAKVTVLYRRTEREMPADFEEIKALKEEKIEIVELVSPREIIVDDGAVSGLICDRMELGAVDDSGRRRPVKIPGSSFALPCDLLIPAIGQELSIDFMERDMAAADPETLETKRENIFIGGDAVRGASTIIKAVADGRKVAENILKRAGYEYDFDVPIIRKDLSPADYQQKSARRSKGVDIPELDPGNRRSFETVIKTLDLNSAKKEAERCLYCNDICNVCVTVCPNRANISYSATPVEYKIFSVEIINGKFTKKETEMFSVDQKYQTANIGDFCNECGNCTTFCPTNGAPFKDKPKFYLSREAFEAEDNGFYIDSDAIFAKYEGDLEKVTETDGFYLYEKGEVSIKLDKESLMPVAAENIAKGELLSTKNVALMVFLFENVFK